MQAAAPRVGGVKEFLVYNLMRLLLLASALVIVIGTWSLFADEVPLLWALVLALLLSGLTSWFLLARQREALARVIEARAGNASQKFEEYKGRADDE